MYSPTLQKDIADARIDGLRRARRTAIEPHRYRDDASPRRAARWGLLSRAGIRRVVFADPSRAN